MKPGKFTNRDITRAAIKVTTIYEKGTPGELHVIHYISDDGFETMLTHWYPSEDDIRRMINGRPIALHIVGNRHSWVKLEVSEKEGYHD